mmetsp:Transcript_12977/g.29933  ORF Transcript_12977/g.29933 Transcript_12977/m.29933 type:complete len:221 (+) Transcript_12977:299-961(+)
MHPARLNLTLRRRRRRSPKRTRRTRNANLSPTLRTNQRMSLTRKRPRSPSPRKRRNPPTMRRPRLRPSASEKRHARRPNELLRRKSLHRPLLPKRTLPLPVALAPRSVAGQRCKCDLDIRRFFVPSRLPITLSKISRTSSMRRAPRRRQPRQSAPRETLNWPNWDLVAAPPLPPSPRSPRKLSSPMTTARPLRQKLSLVLRTSSSAPLNPTSSRPSVRRS